MVDHVRTLLINRDDEQSGYKRVSDGPADRVMALFGVTGECAEVDSAAVDLVLPLALAPDLIGFRSRFDTRLTPPGAGSVYRHEYQACCGGDDCVPLSADGVYQRVLGPNGRGAVLSLFGASDSANYADLAKLREAALSMDGAYALGAVLLACAFRRLVLLEGGKV